MNMIYKVKYWCSYRFRSTLSHNYMLVLYYTVKSHFKALGLYNFIRGFGWVYKWGGGGLISGWGYIRNNIFVGKWLISEGLKTGGGGWDEKQLRESYFSFVTNTCVIPREDNQDYLLLVIPKLNYLVYSSRTHSNLHCIKLVVEWETCFKSSTKPPVGEERRIDTSNT